MTSKTESTPGKSKDLHLPISRIKTIMKSSPDVEAVGADALYMVTKVTELFVVDLAKRAFKNCNGTTLEYKQAADIVQKDDTLDFLREIMPCKITVHQYAQIMAAKAAKGNNSSSEIDSDSSEEESESDTSK